MGRDRLTAFGCALLAGSTGFVLHNSLFVWPKLIAGAYCCFAALPVLAPHRPLNPLFATAVGASAALGWLSHGSIAFSLLALLIVWLARGAPHRQHFVPALATFVAIVIPWLLYQQLIDPPGNRLLKWHLAGVIPIDPRGTWQTLRDAYQALSWQEWWFARKANFLVTIDGDFSNLFDFSLEGARQRRGEEFFYLFRSIGFLNFVWLLWPVARLCKLAPPLRQSQVARALAAWLVLTYTIWVTAMFIPSSTIIHHGSYTMLLGLISLAIVLAQNLPLLVRAALFTAHAAYFGSTWLAYDGSAAIRSSMVALTVLSLLALAALYLRARRSALNPAQTSTSPSQTPSSSTAAIHV